jgi:hypothetical protein
MKRSTLAGFELNPEGQVSLTLLESAGFHFTRIKIKDSNGQEKELLIEDLEHSEKVRQGLKATS